MKRGKQYIETAKKVDTEKRYLPQEAVELVKGIKYSKFDETVEVHFNLGIDPRHADQQLRGTVVLPNGTGKTTRVAVVCSSEKVAEAKKAGADEAGSEDLIEKIESGWLEFDVLIASPDMMAKVGRLGRVLGSKGLMPNVKSGTVSADIGKAVKDFKAGKVEYRNDKQGLIHLGIGKVSFETAQLLENFQTIYDVLLKAKPSKSKGVYMKSISMSSTMGKGVFIEPMKVRWKD